MQRAIPTDAHGTALRRVFNLGLAGATTTTIWHALEHGVAGARIADADGGQQEHQVSLLELAPFAGVTADAPGDGGEIKIREAKEKFVGQWERDFFINALRGTGGNISRAAERAGMYRQNFQQKMRELGISVDDLGLKTQDE